MMPQMGVQVKVTLPVF